MQDKLLRLGERSKSMIDKELLAPQSKQNLLVHLQQRKQQLMQQMLQWLLHNQQMVEIILYQMGILLENKDLVKHQYGWNIWVYLLLRKQSFARESNGQVNAANASGASGLLNNARLGVQLQQLMIKSRLHTMHIALSFISLGLVKNRFTNCKPIFLMSQKCQEWVTNKSGE